MRYPLRFSSVTLASLVFVVALLLLALRHWYEVPVSAEGLPIGPADPDPWLRLTLVRDWLLSGDWYDHRVLRTHAPTGGITTPWTRPLDLVIAALVKLQPASVDLSLRLLRAALLLPWIWMSLLLLGLLQLGKQRAYPTAARGMTLVVLILTPLMWNYFDTGNADHHAPLAVCFVWALVGLMRGDARGLLLAAGLFALQLWMSVEAMLLIALVDGWFALRWLRGEASALRQWRLLAIATLCFATLALMAEVRPAAWAVPVYDRISIVNLVVLAVAAAIPLLLSLRPLTQASSRWLALGVLSSLGLLLVHRLYPLAYLGPLAEVDPYILTDFLPKISEAQPITHQPLLQILSQLILPLVALAYSAATFGCGTPRQRFLAYLLTTTLLLFCLQIRWSYYCLPLAILTVAELLGTLYAPAHAPQNPLARWMLAHSEPQRANARIAALLGILALPLGLGYASPAYENALASPEQRARHEARITCERNTHALLANGAITHALGDAPLTVFTSTNLGTKLLFFTPYRILASNYHREGEDIRTVWEAEKLTDENALRHVLATHGVEALLLCPHGDMRNDSVLTQVMRHQRTLTWAQEIPLTGPKPTLDALTAPTTLPVLLRVTRAPQP